jgi:GNAT superfamily N-acetyltransferase
MIIRRARIGDVEQIANILVSFHQYFSDLDNENRPIQKDKIARDIKNLSFGRRPLLYIFVAEEAGRIVGAISFYNGFMTSLNVDTMFHVPYLFVDPEFRGGRALFPLLGMIRGIANKTGVKRICFSVYGKNELARKIYERMGAKYWADEDEHFMFYDTR